MTDKEILDEVYHKLNIAIGGGGYAGDIVAVRRFIEQERQKQDNMEHTTYSKVWYSPTGPRGPEGRSGER